MVTGGHLFWKASHDKDKKELEYKRKQIPKIAQHLGLGYVQCLPNTHTVLRWSQHRINLTVVYQENQAGYVRLSKGVGRGAWVCGHMPALEGNTVAIQ